MTLVCVESPAPLKCESVKFHWKLCLFLIQLQVRCVKSWLTFCSASQFTRPTVFLLDCWAPFDGIRHILRWNLWASYSPKGPMQSKTREYDWISSVSGMKWSRSISFCVGSPNESTSWYWMLVCSKELHSGYAWGQQLWEYHINILELSRHV